MSGEDKHSIIRLKPKVSPDKILAGFPWVYDNELVLDRRTKQLTSGKIVELQDSARNFWQQQWSIQNQKFLQE